MNKKIIVTLTIILLPLILWLGMGNKIEKEIKEEVVYLDIIRAYTVDDYGTWKIDFSDEVEINNEMRNNVKIIDINEGVLDTDISYADYEKRSILVKCLNNKIEVDKDYMISITEITSSNGNKLKAPFTKNFRLSRMPINIVNVSKLNEYDWEVVFDQEVLKGEKTNDNIRIYNSKKKLINKKIDYKEGEKSTLIIKPDRNELRIGETYTMYIGEIVENKWDSRLGNSILKEFKVDKIEIDEDLGLGKLETARKTLDRDYEWYIDQIDTGDNYENNAGPTVAVMASNWAIKGGNFTVEDARKLYYPEGDKWYWHTILDYLNYNKITSEVIEEMTSNELKKYIDNNNIVIVTIDCTKIPINTNDKNRVNRFDKDLKENFIIVKGYRIVDDELYFEVYDPYSLGRKYDDTSLKGKNRYYNAKILISAMESSENSSIILYQK